MTKRSGDIVGWIHRARAWHRAAWPLIQPFLIVVVAVAVLQDAYWRRYLWIAIAVLVFGAAALASAVLTSVERRRFQRGLQRMRDGLCPACGYDLRGSGEACSECGWPHIGANEPLHEFGHAVMIPWTLVRRSAAQRLYIAWAFSQRTELSREQWGCDTARIEMAMVVTAACRILMKLPNCWLLPDDPWQMVVGEKYHAFKDHLAWRYKLNVTHAQFASFARMRMGQVVDELVRMKVGLDKPSHDYGSNQI
jgi:hypothetical protein